jgi:hypothetical protein
MRTYPFGLCALYFDVVCERHGDQQQALRTEGLSRGNQRGKLLVHHRGEAL